MAQQAWTCPECGRQVPRQVDVCRCGVERSRLAAIGYTLDIGAEFAASTPRIKAAPGFAGTLIGYRPDTTIGRGSRLVLKTLFVTVVSVAGWALVAFTHGALPPRRDHVEILSTLDAHTRNAGADATNTIPDFLSLPGATGIIERSMAPTDLLKEISEAELRQGFCSQSVARQIRYQYPGFYESWPDAKLESLVLEKYPEYRDRVCVLSSRIDASPDEIVKYKVKPPSLLGQAGLWLRTLLIIGLFAIGCMNFYYRSLVPRLST
jgi:hypothetical protein